MIASYPWWRHAVVYQVYIRSFADGNGDGTGDIAGLRSRLPYLAALGIDAIWVNPWYESPMNDGGYDVADYRSINPLFGTLDEAKLLIDEARSHGIRLLVDLVPNHTSSEHEWFQAALAADPASPERERYHFLPGKGHGGEFPPNDWQSVFGGPAWTRVPDGEWYLHLFDPSQPDLNWRNPEVRAEFESIIRFWLDRGCRVPGRCRPLTGQRLRLPRPGREPRGADGDASCRESPSLEQAGSARHRRGVARRGR